VLGRAYIYKGPVALKSSDISIVKGVIACATHPLSREELARATLA
jgi:hypothetical protein